MKRAGLAKFPSSIQLFKFCQKVMTEQRGSKVRDQEVGAILNYNPSDCSHWKRGEKSVRSVFALAKLAETLNVEPSLLHDITSGLINLDEAYFEYAESRSSRTLFAASRGLSGEEVLEVRTRINDFTKRILVEAEFTTPPLYLPEVMRSFSFVSTQPVEMIDKLSRILRVRPGTFCIQYKKGDLKAQTRMSMVKDLARIVFHAERERFPELGPLNQELLALEEALFTANLLVPKGMMAIEMAKLDTRKNVVAELATLFWAPKSLVSFQLQDTLREGTRMPVAIHAAQVSIGAMADIQI